MSRPSPYPRHEKARIDSRQALPRQLLVHFGFGRQPIFRIVARIETTAGRQEISDRCNPLTSLIRRNGRHTTKPQRVEVMGRS